MLPNIIGIYDYTTYIVLHFCTWEGTSHVAHTKKNLHFKNSSTLDDKSLSSSVVNSVN